MNCADGRHPECVIASKRDTGDSRGLWLAKRASGFAGTWYSSSFDDFGTQVGELRPEEVLSDVGWGADESHDRDAQSRGWPFRALWCEVCWNDNSGWYANALTGGLTLPHKSTNIDGAPELPVLPLRPIWPGFAINSIFYAALLWVLWMVPGKIRRLVRIRRGCCSACGYKIAPGVGNKCSECGAELPERLRKEHN
jgi:hypothetical protein